MFALYELDGDWVWIVILSYRLNWVHKNWFFSTPLFQYFFVYGNFILCKLVVLRIFVVDTFFFQEKPAVQYLTFSGWIHVLLHVHGNWVSSLSDCCFYCSNTTKVWRTTTSCLGYLQIFQWVLVHKSLETAFDLLDYFQRLFIDFSLLWKLFF